MGGKAGAESIEGALLLKEMDVLVAVLGAVALAGDVDPEVFAVGGFDDGLVKVRVRDNPIEPAVENLLVGMCLAITLWGVPGDGDADALYVAMERMLTDEPMRKSMAGKARQMIADRFEKNIVQKSQIAFYEEIL